MVQGPKTFSLFCLLLLGIVCINCSPTHIEKNYYNDLMNACPSIRNNSNFEKIPLVKACNNSPSDNKLAVTCLLYFNVFKIYCQTSDKVEYFLEVDEKPQSPQEVCKDLGIIPKVENGTELLKKIFPKEEVCVGFCSDEFGMTSTVCKLAHFFSQLINNNTIKKSTVGSSASASSTQKISSSSTTTQKISASTAAQTPKIIEQKKEEATNQNYVNKTIIKQEDDLHLSVLKAADKAVLIDTKTPPPAKEGVGQETVQQADTNPPSVPVVLDEKNDLKEEKAEKPAEETTKKQTTAATSTETKKIDPVIEQEEIAEISAAEPPQNSVGDNIGGLNEDGGSLPDEEEELYNINVNKDSPGKHSKGETSDDSDSPANYATEMDGDSYFFTYFMVLCIVFVVGYVCYHNKQKILALILEGRRGRKQYRGRRPNSANYHKLDSNLEEAITSSCSKNPSNVIY